MNKQSPQSKSNPRDKDDSDSLVERSHEVAETVKQAALDRVDTVRKSTQTLRDETAERVRKLGETVRKVGEHCRVEEQHYVAEQMNGASQRMGKLADYIASAELGEIVRDTRDIARTNPAAFFGGAFLVGLGVGRFFKGTSLVASGGATSVRRTSRAPAELPSDLAGADDDLLGSSQPNRRRKNAGYSAGANEPERGRANR